MRMRIYPIRTRFSMAFLVVEGQRAMLVDAATPEAASTVITQINDLGVELPLIVLTHFHFDHVGAADAIRDATGARVAIHRADAEALRAGGKMTLVPTGLLPRLMAPGINRTDQASVVPDIELGDEEDLGAYGGFGRSFSTPGHTPGSISVVLDDGTVFAGDALTAGLLTHRPRGPMFIDDAARSRASIRAIADRATDLHVAHFGNGHIDADALRRFASRQRG